MLVRERAGGRLTPESSLEGSAVAEGGTWRTGVASLDLGRMVAVVPQ